MDISNGEDWTALLVLIEGPSTNKPLGGVIMVIYLDENMQFQLNALIRVLDNVQLHPLVFYELLKL